MKFGSFVAAACIGMGAMTLLSAEAKAQFYKDKTINIIVGSGAGGTMDTNARQIAFNIGKYLPGNPDVVVQNMPGGAALLATNYVYEVAKPDGLTLYYGAFVPTAQLLGLEELRADYNKFEIVGATAEIRAVVMRTDTPPGIKTPADIAKTTGFFVGGTSASGSQEILNRLSLDILGIDYKMITGYGAGSETRAAILRNEIQFLNNSYASLVRTFGDSIKAGEFIPVYYFCYIDKAGNIVRQEHIKDTPCFVDLYKEIRGDLPSGPAWDTLNFYSELSSKMLHILAAPPGTPKELTDQISEAYYKAMQDPAVIDFYKSQTGSGPEVASLEDAHGVIQSMATVSPEIVAVLKKYYESDN